MTTDADYLAANPRSIGMLVACLRGLESAARAGASNLGTISGP